MTRRPLVLLVDDEEDLRELTALVLEEAGYDVSHAHHGAKALEVLQGGLTPDVIILDLTMPVMNGWDVWDWLKQSPFAQTPVVIWTATGLTDGAVGTARVIAKSDLKLLMQVVRDLTTTAAPPATTTPTTPPATNPTTATTPATTSTAAPAETVDAGDDDAGGGQKA